MRWILYCSSFLACVMPTTLVQASEKAPQQQSLHAPFSVFLKKWVAGQEQDGIKLLSTQTLPLVEMARRSAVPFGTAAHDAYIVDFKQDKTLATARIRLFYYLPKPNQRNVRPVRRELSIVEDIFTLQATGSSEKFAINDFQSRNVTVEMLKEVHGMLDRLTIEYQNSQRSLTARRQRGLILCSTYWQIWEPQHAWPLLRELCNMKPTESVGELQALQVITRKMLALEPPTEEYRELAKRILLMTPDKKD
jgi:hypothetical protein